MQTISFELNGKITSVRVEAAETLLFLLRERLQLTGAKLGCGESECGACTVLLDGRPVNSCILPAAKADGRRIVTIEGLSRDGEMDYIQSSFVEAGAVQCGFCIPGVILSAKAILDQYDDPTEEIMRQELSGHLCRCTGYQQFFDAIRLAAAKLRKYRSDNEKEEQQ